MSIRAQNISKTFDGGKTFALKEVSLAVEPGQFVAIIGLSGAGKSTFLRALNGTVPVTGQLEVLGQDVTALKGRALSSIRRRIGFIFQQFNLVKNLTALQNVLVGRSGYAPLWRVLTGKFAEADLLLARKALDTVGLPGRYHEKVRNLSGGQQQRVAIARALVQQPEMILADEPMASLDPRLSELVLENLAKINREQKLTVLVNIHVLELAKKYAQRIVAFRAGRVVFDGTPEALTPGIVAEIYRHEGGEW